MAKVLVVDDSVSVRKALERVLAPRQLEVIAANSAEQALEKVTMTRPDLVITDVVMPGMNGFEFCQMLKNTELFADIPVILISGIVDDHVLNQSKQVGASSVVTKPFTPDDLFPKIDRALGITTANQSVVTSAPLVAAAVASAVSSHVPVTPPPAPVVPPVSASAPVQTPAPIIPQPPIAPILHSLNLSAHLEPFLEKSEIETALLVNPNGEALSTAGKALPDADLFATFCRTLVSISGAFGQHLGNMSLNGVTLEYSGKNILLYRVNGSVSLALVMQGGTSGGIARYLVQRQVPQIKAALEAN